MNSTTRKMDGEVMSVLERSVELLALIPMVFLFVFFAYHQLTNTGFFTTSFGPLEMVCFYGPILTSVAAPLVRASSGNRTLARPFEISSNLFLAFSSLYLLTVFPFDFYHFGDLFPGPFHFVFSFFTNGIGMLFLILQVIGGAIGAVVGTAKLISVLARAATA